MGKTTRGINYYARMPADRLVCGLMHVIIRNSSGVDDAVDEYYTHWGGSAPTAGKAASPFDGTQPINTVDPDRTGYGQGIGDYDCLLIYVIAGCHLQIEDYAGAQKDQAWFDANTPPEYPGGDDPNKGWYTNGEISHPACQSFVRYKVLSRGNNAYGHGNTWYKNPIVTTTQTSTEGLNVTDTPTSVNLLSDTKFDYSSSVYSDTDYHFGSDLSSAIDTNNNYMSPLAGINIVAGHKFETTTMTNGVTILSQLVSHEYDFYNLVLQMNLFAYDGGSSSDFTFFKNRINVFFQPFGETSNIEFSLTEYTT